MQSITTIGVDVAKSVFQVHCVDAAGQVVMRRQLKRRYVLAFFQKLPPCLVGIEACASSHRGDLRGGYPTEYAVRCNQDIRATELPDATSHPPFVHPPANFGD